MDIVVEKVKTFGSKTIMFVLDIFEKLTEILLLGGEGMYFYSINPLGFF